MKFAFIASKEVAFPVATMCRTLGVSPSGYYSWKVRPAPKRASEDARLAADVAAAHKGSRGIYGSPRVHAELLAQGRGTSRGRIERLMRRHGICAIMAGVAVLGSGAHK